MSTLERYLRIYKALIKTNVARMAAYPGNFYSAVFSALIFTGLHIVSAILLTSKTKTVYGWTQNDIIILTLVFNLVRSMAEIFFNEGLIAMSSTIFKGELDGLLLKPMNSQFFLSFRLFEFPGIIRAILTLLILSLFMLAKGIPVSFIEVIIFGLLSIVGIILLYSIWFIVSTLLIWNPVLSNLRDLVAFVTSLLRYPPDLFRSLGAAIFIFFLPLLLVVVPSTHFLLGKTSFSEIGIMLLMAVSFLYASHLFWQFALRHYSSASS